MTLLDAQQIGSSHDCAWPGCPREARDAGGYCDIGHVGEPPTRTERGSVAPGSYAHLADDDEPPVPPVRTTARENVIERIRAYHAAHGYCPAGNEDLSLRHHAIKAFGSWGDAIEAAGFPRPTRGGNRKKASSVSSPSNEATKTEAKPPLPAQRQQSAGKPPPPRKGQAQRTPAATRPRETALAPTPAAPEKRTADEPPTLVELAQEVEDTRRQAADAIEAHYTAKGVLERALEAKWISWYEPRRLQPSERPVERHLDAGPSCSRCGSYEPRE